MSRRCIRMMDSSFQSLRVTFLPLGHQLAVFVARR
jgi:hypothetical protein